MTTVLDVGSALASVWEQRLAARLAAGDADALTEAFAQFGGFVHGLANRVAGDPSAADEVVQSVFVELWEQPEKYDPERGSLRAFLGVLTHRRAVDWHRREAAARRRAERSAAHHVGPAPDVAEAATALLMAERVREAVDALPEDQRRALRLAYFDGLTYRQVAAALGIPEGTAKSRLRLALARLAIVLERDEVTPWT